jgi:hypothetical protein
MRRATKTKQSSLPELAIARDSLLSLRRGGACQLRCAGPARDDDLSNASLADRYGFASKAFAKILSDFRHVTTPSSRR